MPFPHLKQNKFLILLMVIFFAIIDIPEAQESQSLNYVSPQKAADYIHSIIEADRTIYSQYIVERLEETIFLKATENWEEENTLLLPAQFLRLSSQLINSKNSGMKYRLISQWPINPENKPKTQQEIKGLKSVTDNPSKPFTWEAKKNNSIEFNAIYPDKAITKSCSNCHNKHPKSPKVNYKQGDVMGGIHISFPISKTKIENKNIVYGVAPEVLVDYVHSILDSDRTVYAKLIVNRLQKEKIIYPSENWWEENTLLLPAQFLLNASDLIRNMRLGLDYRLISLWPINPQNGPANEFERKGLETVSEQPIRPYIGSLKVGNKKYFQAVYPDMAVTPACISCHNGHPKSPKHDFKLYDVIGGIMVSLLLD